MELMNRINKEIIYCLILSVSLFVGCDNVDTTKVNTNKDYGEGYASMCVSYVKLYKDGGSISKFKRSQCPYCKGSGKVKSGDGIITMDCPYCEPDVKSEVTKQQCCQHCICDDCQCSYPGECLIKKNAGWPVCICKDGVCVKYMPRNDKGEAYNPYDLLSPSDKRKYEYLKDGVCVDENGDELPRKVENNKTTYSSGGCTSCGVGRGLF